MWPKSSNDLMLEQLVGLCNYNYTVEKRLIARIGISQRYVRVFVILLLLHLDFVEEKVFLVIRQ